MRTLSWTQRRTARAVLTFWFFLLAAALPAADWRPVDPAELQLSAPALDPDAGAEILYWEVRINDRAEGGSIFTNFQHYFRVKVFTAKGAAGQTSVELPFGPRTTISDLSARTLTPAGASIDVGRDAFQERELIKFGRRKIRAKTFAFSSVEPGCILEYQYRETRMDYLANYLHLEFQRDLPIHRLKYFIKPLKLPWLPFEMRAFWLQTEPVPFQTEAQGYYSVSLEKIPAFRREPAMPPEDSVRPWMLIYYEEDRGRDVRQYWQALARAAQNDFEQRSKPNGDLRKAAQEVITGAATEEEKLAALYRHARRQVRNVFRTDAGVTPKQREDFKPNRHAADAYKQGLGTARDINLVFGALARAAGYDARVARIADRSIKLFQVDQPNGHFLQVESVAIRDGGGWRYYDAASRDLPPGGLRWQEEGTAALIGDEKALVLLKTPLKEPAESAVQRQAIFKLDEEGGLDGKATFVYSGHQATERRTEYRADTAVEREEAFRDDLLRQFPGAEISGIQFDGFDAPEKPLAITFRLRAPHYAQRTGKRFFVAPAVFQSRLPTRFASAERRHDVYFPYPWSEHDRIQIVLPAGYEMEQPSAPGRLPLGEVGEYEGKLYRTTGPPSVILERRFRFGSGGRFLFPKAAYGDIKKVFDLVHELDAHAVALKSAGGGL